MVIGEARGDFEVRAERNETLLETLGPGDSAERGDVFPAQVLERSPVFWVVKILQVERLVLALDDLCGPIETADPLDELRVSSARTFRDEDVARTAEVNGRLSQRPAREEILVSERSLG